MKTLQSTLILAGAAAIAGCASMPTPRNAAGAQYQAEQQLADARLTPCRLPEVPQAVAGLVRRAPESLSAAADLLGPGDRLRLDISGDKDVLSGTYVIAANGHLVIDGIADVPAAGRSRREVEQAIKTRLVDQGLVRDVANNVRLSVVEAAGVQVSVAGAVFEPGIVRAGERTAESRATTVGNPAAGDFNAGRSLATALRAAGGIRPDAAAQSLYLVRGDSYAVIDVTPAFTGGVPADPQLAPGDRIFVPTAGCFQARFVRPSSVTAPGVRVYLSNLSRPAASNAASAIGRDSTSFPYGARMLDALVSANCVGGSALNAARRSVLISRNPITGQSVVIARDVEDLVRNADRDSRNPFLMPGDALACYDSRAMTLVDAVNTVGGLLGPAALVNGLSQ